MRRLSAPFLLIVLAACATHATPPTEGVYPDVIKHPIPEDLSVFKQPKSLIEDMEKLRTGTLKERLRALADKSIRDQVHVKGGTFLMGDFGPQQSKEKLPWSGRADTMPLHTVTLDDYSISRYKVTFAEFDVYTEANNLPKIHDDEKYTKSLLDKAPIRQADKPVWATWKQAKAYCDWLANLTNRPFDLPTEAQWEFVARNRGQFIVWPTENGVLEWNKNVPAKELIESLMNSLSGDYPIAHFPPSPMGLYDLPKLGLEWMQDWYAADYYQHSNNAKNPAGPAEGIFKVQRSWPLGDTGAGMTMQRRYAPPGSERVYDPINKMDRLGGGRSDTFRCATQPAEHSKNN